MADTEKTLKDKVTNWISGIVVVGTAVLTAINAIPDGVEWYVWVSAGLFSIYGWFTGKSGDLKGSQK